VYEVDRVGDRWALVADGTYLVWLSGFLFHLYCERKYLLVYRRSYYVPVLIAKSYLLW
jgi:hypothetical protein